MTALAHLWAREAIRRIAADAPAVLVTVVATEGSAPRDAGARMIVGTTDIWGTVGGGNLEHQLIIQARRLIERDDVFLLQQDYPLGPLLAQCCGGRVRVLLERLDCASTHWLAPIAASPGHSRRWTLEGRIGDGRIVRRLAAGWQGGAQAGFDLIDAIKRPAGLHDPWVVMRERIEAFAPELYLFGAGHVGWAFAHIAKTLPFRLAWIDTRPEIAAADAMISCRNPLEAVAEAEAGAFYLVLTHSHDLDLAIVRSVLSREDCAYCGLIGSETKRARFISRLAKDGITAGRLVCPIGAGSIRSKDPAFIAVSVAADLLQRLEALRERTPDEDVDQAGLLRDQRRRV